MMRLVLLFLALTLVTTTAHAQSAEADALAALLNEEDSGSTYEPLYIACGVTAALTCVLLVAYLIGESTYADGEAVLVRADGDEVVLADPATATHAIRVIEEERTGVGVGAEAPARTISLTDLATRQPVALGPLGGSTATVRSLDDLRALLSDR